MATETVIQRPAPFVEEIGKKLSEQALGLQDVPVVTTGIGGITRQTGETDAGFKARQDAARAFTTRQQNLAGIAPEVAPQDALQTAAQRIAEQQAGLGTTQEGIGSFAPFLQQAQAAAADAGTALGGVGLGAQAFQQDVQQFMSPYQSQVIDATLAEFDRNKAIQEQSIRDQQTAFGALGSGRAGVQLAEFGTGAARERALLQASLLQQGFGQAQRARQQDIQNRFGLGQAQQGLAGQQLGQAQFQTGLASLVPGLQRADVGQLGALGAIDRSLSQAQLDAQRQATQQAAFLPQQQLDRFAGQVTGLMGGYPGGTRQEFIPQPTPLQSALGIATTLGGLYLGSR